MNFERLLNLPLIREIKKMASFGAIGLVNAVVDYAIFFIILILFLRPNELEDNIVPIIIANFIAWGFAVTGSYVLNSKITFKRESGGTLTWKQYASFAAAGLFGMAANTLTVLVLKLFMPLLIAKLVAIGVSFVINFTIARFFVFKR
jgi:putative flippase GtrA